MKTIIFILILSFISCTKPARPNIDSTTIKHLEKKLTQIEAKIDKSKDESFLDKLFPILLSLVSAVIVAFVTSYLLRQTEYDKIIYQKRADMFYHYILDIDIAIRNTSGKVLAYLTNEQFKEQQHFVDHVRTDFIPIINKSIGIKLFLNEEDRERFYKLVDSMRRLAIEAYTEKTESITEMEKTIIKIEKIFQKNLDDITHKKSKS